MIVAEIKMWPKGNAGNAYDLGRIEIINIGGTLESGDYEVKLYKSASHGATKPGVWRRGRVRGFPRKRLGNYDLILRALAACCGDRSPEVVRGGPALGGDAPAAAEIL